MCFNDGAIDRQGRLVTGTMNYRTLSSPDGCLYRLDSDRTIDAPRHRAGRGQRHRLQPGWDRRCTSPSSSAAASCATTTIRTSGTVSGRRVFAVLPEAEGLPDGIIVDGEGYLWNAHWGGGLVTRYAPDGRVDTRIVMPVPVVTCMAFGGDRLNELYVTTGWYGMTAAEQKKAPGCGDLFRIRTDFTGMLEPRFRG